jgi:hypothetical protein
MSTTDPTTPSSPADVRRADWRFLLPDPSLGRVACAGPPDEELLEALRHVTSSVTVLGATGMDPGEGHDVVVVAAASPRRLEGLGAHLRPGGHVYAETSGRRARACARTLEKQGFGDVGLHWLWPSAAACKELIPLGDRTAAQAALDRRDPGARVRLRARAAGRLLALGRLDLLVPHAAVIGRAP